MESESFVLEDAIMFIDLREGRRRIVPFVTGPLLFRRAARFDIARMSVDSQTMNIRVR